LQFQYLDDLISVNVIWLLWSACRQSLLKIWRVSWTKFREGNSNVESYSYSYTNVPVVEPQWGVTFSEKKIKAYTGLQNTVELECGIGKMP